MDLNLNVAAVGLAGIAAAIFVYTKLSRFSKLSGIPTIGSEGWIGCWVTAAKFMTNATELVQEGYQKYPNTPFKISTLFHWQIIITSREHVEELRKAPDDVLSFSEASNDRLQVEYTMGPEIHHNPYHVAIVRSQLTRNIGAMYPEIRDEIISTFDDLLDLKGNEWKSIPALTSVQQIICRTSNRAFVGLPLCRHQDWVKLNIDYTLEVFKARTAITVVPRFLKHFFVNYATNVGRSRRLGMKLLRPLVEERRKGMKEYGKGWADKPDDFLQWCMDEAVGEEGTLELLTNRMLAANLVALHTSAQSFTHVLFFLAAYPEYMKPLREEVESIVEKEGWTKSSIGKMRKIDSFIRECQRLEGIATVGMSRIALKDFTFSDGTFVPKGSMLSVAVQAIQSDNVCYENANEFRPFRFSDMRDEDGEGVKHLFVTTTPDFLPFGHGKHACPGRFFAATELKTMLAHIVQTYDIKLEDEKAGRPPSFRVMTVIIPHTTAKVMFRRRVD